MELSAFFDRIESHPDLTGIGVDGPETEKPGVIIAHKSGLMTRLPVAVIEAAAWEEIEPVLIGEREPQVLQHMTRVVGYFSRIENWNKSKIGELKDRHKGSYALAE